MKKIYVIGSNGFIGKNFVEFSNNRSLDYIGINREKIDLSKKIISKDLKKYIKKNSVLILLAFKTKHIDKKPSVIDNIDITMNLSKIIELMKPSHVVLFSSMSVFGDKKNYNNYDESSLVSPDNEYGIAKVFSENILNSLKKISKLNLTIVRIPRVFGKYDYAYNYGPTSFLHNIIRKKPLKIWGDGKEKKHFLYIKDLFRIIEIIIKRKIIGTFIIVPKESYSFKQLALKCINLTDSKSRIISKKRIYDGSNHLAKNNKIMKELKKFRFTPIDKAIKEYYNELK